MPGSIDAFYGGSYGLGSPYYVMDYHDQDGNVTGSSTPPGWSALPGYYDDRPPLFAANPGGPIAFGATASPPALLPQIGVPLGLGCTAYYLNVTAVNGIPGA